VELVIILDVVVANLGTDEDVAPNVIADTAAKVFHEVIAAGVVDAAGDVTRDREIESGAGNADSGEQVEAKFPAETRLEKCVEVGQDGAVGLIAVVVRLPLPKGSFEAKAKTAVPEANEVTADGDVAAAFLRRLLEVQASGGWGGGDEGAEAHSDVNLLSMSESGKQSNAGSCDEREFSQYRPLVGSLGLRNAPARFGGTPARPAAIGYGVLSR
jgi:hypothetical protein